jgi:hypothetical protein
MVVVTVGAGKWGTAQGEEYTANPAKLWAGLRLPGMKVGQIKYLSVLRVKVGQIKNNWVRLNNKV